MEGVLETCERPCDPQQPVLCMDEQQVQLVRERCTKRDRAREVAAVVEGRYAACDKVTLVPDNLDTHTVGAFYQAFKPARARAPVRRIDFHCTPKHGSWLNIAENEVSALTRQCLGGRRIGDPDTLCTEIAAWSTDLNRRQRGVDWQMKIEDARRKLKSVYPKSCSDEALGSPAELANRQTRSKEMAPAAAGALKFKCAWRLEHKAQSELELAVETSASPKDPTKAARPVRRIRSVELRCVRQVERLDAELHLRGLGNREVLEQ